MLTELGNELQDFIESSKQFMPIMLKWMAVLWAFNFLNWQTGSKLNAFGIRPRRAIGLIGIVLAPILHGNFNHLFFNSLPLFFLGIFIMSLNLQLFYIATVIITFFSGLGVWLVGRRGIHIGASALISGYFGYVLANAYQKPTFTALFCAAIAFYYFGSILLSLFPTEEGTSWEGHLCGFLSGILAAVICLHLDTILSVFHHYIA